MGAGAWGATRTPTTNWSLPPGRRLRACREASPQTPDENPGRYWPVRPGSARALPQLVAAACQVGGLGGVARELDGVVVCRARLLTAAQPAQQFGPSRVVGVIAGQLLLEAVDGRQCHLRAVKLGDRDRPVE